MAGTMTEKLLIWVSALFYGLVLMVWMIRRSFQVGLKKYITAEKLERPACLDDPGLGTHGYLHLEDIRIHYVASGPEDKPLMLFVHGFPDFWYSWRHQIKEFQKDYRVVAFDLRGYGDSDKPKGKSAYTVPKLLSDIKQVILALGYNSCVLVSHDWGGILGWAFGRLYPQFVDRLVVMNAPSLPQFEQLLRTDPVQRKCSWYVFLFQLPFLPELSFKTENFASFERVLKSGGNVTPYKYTFSQPGALTPPINFYRAALQLGENPSHDFDYSMPVLLIWGCQDTALSMAIPNEIEKENPKISVKRLEDVGHFVQHESPEAVNKAMREWLTERQ